MIRIGIINISGQKTKPEPVIIKTSGSDLNKQPRAKVADPDTSVVNISPQLPISR